MWQPIETAPKDNKRPLWLAHFDGGALQSFDYNGSWERECESWEMPEVYYFWASENGNVEEPTHWAYQPDEFYTLSEAQPAPSVPEDVMRDAERYRYLRARDDDTAGVGCWIEADGSACDRGWLYGVQLDSAIDSFIEVLAAAPKPEGE